MPRVNLGVESKELDVKAVIAYYMALRGINSRQAFAPVIGMKPAATNTRMREPDRLTVKQLRAVYDYLKVPDAERVGL